MANLSGEADENNPDTNRIQQAIDSCPTSHAVKLAPDGGRDTFLSGPLQLRSGVTLQIDKGAILLASRNPRDYDIRPGSCGIVNEKGRGCKALINGDHADHAAVMGEGTIDGRVDQNSSDKAHRGGISRKRQKSRTKIRIAREFWCCRTATISRCIASL